MPRAARPLLPPDHYLNHPSILLRMTRVDVARMKELLEDARETVLKKPRKP